MWKMGIAALACFVLVACGNTRGERALTGAGIGAASGALGAAILDGDTGIGAVLGGLAGAGIGAATADRGRNNYSYNDGRGRKKHRHKRKHRKHYYND